VAAAAAAAEEDYLFWSWDRLKGNFLSVGSPLFLQSICVYSHQELLVGVSKYLPK